MVRNRCGCDDAALAAHPAQRFASQLISALGFPALGFIPALVWWSAQLRKADAILARKSSRLSTDLAIAAMVVLSPPFGLPSTEPLA